MDNNNSINNQQKKNNNSDDQVNNNITTSILNNSGVVINEQYQQHSVQHTPISSGLNTAFDISNNNNELSLDCNCDSILDNIETLHLECLEYIELTSPTNIYSYSHLQFDADLLLVATRNNLLAINAIEDEKTRGLQWFTKDIKTPLSSSSNSPRLSPSASSPTSPTVPNSSSNNNNDYYNRQQQPLQQQQQQQQQNQQQQPPQPSQQMMKSHLQRLPLSHKSRIPPLPMKTPTSSLPTSPLPMQQQSGLIPNPSHISGNVGSSGGVGGVSGPSGINSSSGISSGSGASGSNTSGTGVPITAKHPQQPQEDTIVSIDSLNEGPDTATIAVAMVSSQSANARGSLTFHIYKSQSNNTAPKIQMLPLDFIPFHMTHTTISNAPQSKSVFLLSGSDDRVHLYKMNEFGVYIEGNTQEYFPELLNLQSNVMRIIVNYHLNYRFIIAGCQNGFLQLSITDLNTNQKTIESCYFDGPVQTICLFTDKGKLETNEVPRLSKMKSFQSSLLNDLLLQMKQEHNTNSNVDQQSQLDKDNPLNQVHLAVGSIIGYVMVYRDIVNKKLQDYHLLEDSDSFDGVTCLDVFDIDGDGENEILVGTYSMELLVYKLKSPQIHQNTNQFNPHTSPTSNSNIPTSPKSNTSSPTILTITSPSSSTSSLPAQQQHHPTYQLVSHKHFSHPILGILNCKLLKDGLYQTIIISMYGIYIMRTPIYIFEKDVKDKLDLISEILGIEKELSSYKIN